MQARPYLVALGAPPLRFQEIAPPPDLVTRPPAAAPPVPATVAENSSDATPAETPAALAPTLAPVISGTPSATTDSAAAPSDEATPAPARTPPPIIRDELRPQTRPEDFLPFFQIPAGQPGDVNVVVPVPRTPASGTPLPLSSATYTQTPK